MPNTRRLSRYNLLTLFVLVGLISVALLISTGSPSQGETITGTVGKPGAVGTAYNNVDGDYSNQFVQDALIHWPSTRAYRAGSGTPAFNRPQTVSVTYQVFRHYRGNVNLVDSRKVTTNLGTTAQYGDTPSAHLFVDNVDTTFGYRLGYSVITYVSWRNPRTDRLIAARTFKQNHATDYRCVDYNNNGGFCSWGGDNVVVTE